LSSRAERGISSPPPPLQGEGLGEVVKTFRVVPRGIPHNSALEQVIHNLLYLSLLYHI